MNVMNQNWVFGHGAHINFSNLQIGAVQSASLTQIDQVEGCASVSDDNGNLLFYSDGVFVWDSNGNKINPDAPLNGDNSSTQSCIIVPNHYVNGQYYIFTMGGSSWKSNDIGKDHIGPFNSSTKHLDGVIIDITNWQLLPLPWQSVTGSPDDPELNKKFSPAEKLTAIPHENCKDCWIITAVQETVEIKNHPNPDIGKVYLPYQPEAVNGSFVNPFVYYPSNHPLHDPDRSVNSRSCNMQHGPGVLRIFLVNNLGIRHHADIPMLKDNGEPYHIFEMGYLKASPDGTKLAIANGHSGAIEHGQKNPGADGTGRGEVFLFDFDKTSGTATLNHRFETEGAPTLYGLEFSPDSELLYVANFPNEDDGWDGLIFQAPANGSFPANPLAPIITINRQDEFDLDERNPMGALQLGPDGNIYIAIRGKDHLKRITNPNGPQPYDTVSNPMGWRYEKEDKIFLNEGARCQLGLPNLLLPCPDTPCDCDCSCPSCNKNAKAQNEELMTRAKKKMLKGQSGEACAAPFSGNCEKTYVKEYVNPELCFYFHWGNKQNNTITSPETEIFYLTVCNPFKDIRFNGLKITKISLFTEGNPGEEVAIADIQIVPDRFICMDCLMPCSCQAREFAIITRDEDIAGDYRLEVDYCYESITLAPGGSEGSVSFPVEIS